jgi:hypothetical protein
MTIDYDRDQLSYALANALRERDEAREQIDNIRKMLSESGEAVGNGEHDYSIIDMIENLIKSKGYFVRKSDSLERERERDEAREQNTKLLDKLDQLYRIVEIDKLKEGAQ